MTPALYRLGEMLLQIEACCGSSWFIPIYFLMMDKMGSSSMPGGRRGHCPDHNDFRRM